MTGIATASRAEERPVISVVPVGGVVDVPDWSISNSGTSHRLIQTRKPAVTRIAPASSWAPLTGRAASGAEVCANERGQLAHAIASTESLEEILGDTGFPPALKIGPRVQ